MAKLYTIIYFCNFSFCVEDAMIVFKTKYQSTLATDSSGFVFKTQHFDDHFAGWSRFNNLKRKYSR